LLQQFPATKTVLNSAAGTATDGLGNLDIADSGNNIIRKLACVDYVDQAMFTVTNVDISTSSTNIQSSSLARQGVSRAAWQW
jgi:hypothetical protein